MTSRLAEWSTLLLVTGGDEDCDGAGQSVSRSIAGGSTCACSPASTHTAVLRVPTTGVARRTA
ncbi:MAG: hypothetical protein ABS81_05265 [Pseudonocardia sp. SCN 72-86]|nr:MAG: hypothetical protein ABS81_05265 [Pseudonocardia sp. SCN 72-86]